MKSISNSKYTIPLVILLVTAFFTGIYFLMYLNADIVGGVDGSNHYAINKYFSGHIYPHLYGWVNGWYAGMPWPVGYSPLFSYVIATLDHILPFQFDTIFRWFFVIITFLFPLQIYLIAQKLGFRRWRASLFGLFAIFFLISRADFGGLIGIAMGATFENGLYPQFFATYLMLWWLYLFIDESRKRIFWISAFVLGLVFLSNVHTAEISAILFLCFVFVRLYKSDVSYNIKKYVAYLFIAIGVSSLWIIPLVSTADFFLTRAVPPVPLLVALLSNGAVMLLAMFGSYSAVKNKNQGLIAISLSACVLLCISVLPISSLFPGIPFQPFRILSASYLLLYILAPVGILEVIHLLRFRKYHIFIGIFILLLPFLYWYPPVHKSIAGIYRISDETMKMIRDVSLLNDGRSLVEAWKDTDSNYSNLFNYRQPTHFTITALLAASGVHETIWSVFRESSIQSPFVQPLRNIFSYLHESYGVVCYLCDDVNNDIDGSSREFYLQGNTTHFKRARLFGVKYYLIRSDQKKAMMTSTSSQNFVHASTTYGDWTLFEDNQDSSLVSIPRFEPVLIFADMKTSSRPISGENAYDWLRLSEEWFFYGNFDHILVKSNDRNLDLSGDLDKFDTVFISEYSYHDLNKTVEKLKKYSRDKNVIMLSSTDPVYSRLMAEKSKDASLRIFSINRSGNPRRDMFILMSFLATNNKEVVPKNVIINEKDHHSMKISIASSSNSSTNVYLKYSYFPWWKDLRGGSVYLASPAFVLIHTGTSSIEMYFDRNNTPFMVGTIITLLTFIIFLIARYLFRIKYK